MSRKKQPIMLSKDMQRYTGREYFQEIFEKELLNITGKTDAYNVLCFYGIGGIGKTTLKNRFMHVLEGDVESATEKLPKTIYTEFDFNNIPKAESEMYFLVSLRKSLGVKGFKFKYFDAACGKINAINGDAEAKSIVLEQNQALNGMVSIMGAMPVIGGASNALQGLDKLGAIIKSKLDKNDPVIGNEIEHMTIGELKKNLRSYFVMDMQNNMIEAGNKGRQVVIFLDTYEKYSDRFVNDSEGMTGDYWLRRGKNSLIQSIPGVLWVVMGREKLSWDVKDAGWNEENLKNYMLDDFSLEETRCFLNRCGIEDDELCDNLYELTSGTPLFLELCVEVYDVLGSSATIDDFGHDTDELVSRYLDDMQPHFRELSYYMSLWEIWDDDTALGLAEILKEKGVLKTFTPQLYEEFMEHSIVIKQPSDFYYMHSTVRLACLERIPDELADAFNETMDEYYESILASIKDTNVLMGYIDSLFEREIPYELAIGIWNAFIRDSLMNCFANHDNVAGYQLCANLHNHVKDAYPNTGYQMAVDCYYAEFLCSLEWKDEALEIADNEFLDIRYDDIELVDYIRAIMLRAQVYQVCEKYEKSLAEYERAYQEALLYQDDEGRLARLCADGITSMKCMLESEDAETDAIEEYNRRKSELGENHKDTLNAQLQIGISLLYRDEYEAALSEFEKVYSLSYGEYGEEATITFSAYKLMAMSYSYMGEDYKACKIYEDIYRIIRDTKDKMDDDALEAMNNLANAYIYTDNYEKLIGLWEDGISWAQTTFGDDSGEVAILMESLNNMRNELGI